MSTDRDQIENLMARYCRTYDEGDFEAYAELFRHGIVGGPTGTFTTVEEVAAYHRRNCRLYDGKPNTRHVVTNVGIDIDEAGRTASAESYVTIYQATDDFPLQVIFVGSYLDRFHVVDGAWWFLERRAVPHLVGDLSRHAHEYIPPTYKGG
jgi:3-phenylpropionate/cinnamic acid dioxygenase small subunit